MNQLKAPFGILALGAFCFLGLGTRYASGGAASEAARPSAQAVAMRSGGGLWPPDRVGAKNLSPYEGRADLRAAKRSDPKPKAEGTAQNILKNILF